jgi:hypothetical protein
MEQFRATGLLRRAMTESEFELYRGEAHRCRMMARTSTTDESSRRWLELADGYDQVAISIERTGREKTVGRAPMQPVQAIKPVAASDPMRGGKTAFWRPGQRVARLVALLSRFSGTWNQEVRRNVPGAPDGNFPATVAP